MEAHPSGRSRDGCAVLPGSRRSVSEPRRRRHGEGRSGIWNGPARQVQAGPAQLAEAVAWFDQSNLRVDTFLVRRLVRGRLSAPGRICASARDPRAGPPFSSRRWRSSRHSGLSTSRVGCRLPSLHSGPHFPREEQRKWAPGRLSRAPQGSVALGGDDPTEPARCASCPARGSPCRRRSPPPGSQSRPPGRPRSARMCRRGRADDRRSRS